MLEIPLTLPCGLVIHNRIVKAATTEALATRHGEITDSLHRLYEQWAACGAGLLITGNVGFDAAHLVRPGDVIVKDDRVLPSLTAFASRIKQHGMAAVLQVCHAGRQTQRARNPHPVAPSAVAAVKRFNAFGMPREATLEDIDRLREGFVRASLLGEAAGFDGCQIHSAHGYLLSQFLSPLANVRTDLYGGAIENRARLLLEIIRDVKRRRQSSAFAITVKLNSSDFQRGGFTHEDALRVVELLAEEGIDLLEISGGTYEQPASFGDGVPASTLSREAYFLQFAREARSRMRTPLLVTGGFRTRVAMEAALQEGALDLIGLARPFCIEPALGKRLLADPQAVIAAAWKWGGPHALQSLGEMAWYSEQLQRMGQGHLPDPKMSTTAAILRHLYRDTIRGLLERPAPSERLLAAHVIA